MLAHPTLDQLHTLGLHGLAKGFRELEHKPEARSLDHAEWLGLLLEYELTLRRQKQFETRARAAKLRHSASVEDVNYQKPRGLDTARLEAVSSRAIELGVLNCKGVAALLARKPDDAAAKEGRPAPLLDHANLRGPGYYH